MQQKKRWQQVDGVLLLDKPLGLSSNDALQKARRLFSAAKGGHTGTLDPLATGLLPICFGEATKFSADLLDADKTYEACVQLGVTTDTGDAEGQILAQQPVYVEDAALALVLERFRGVIEQVPPMYSALKRDGKPLYALARQGIEVERAPRSVRIEHLELLGRQGDQLALRVRCSKGTYIRTLAEDLGKALGCGAHLLALRRTGVAHLVLDQAPTLGDLEQMDEAQRLACLRPVDSLLQTLPRHDLDDTGATRFLNGNPIAWPEIEAPLWRVYFDERLVGVGECPGDGKLWPKRLVRSAP